MTPDNGYPAVPYNAEYDDASGNGAKDEYLLAMCDEFDHMMTLEDVRPHLNEQFKIRQSLKAAKLI